MQAMVRIRKEFKEVKKDNNSGVHADLVGDDFTHWKGRINGPDDSPYSGGIFVVDIKIPRNYPFEPPKMQFDTKVWHPNISSRTGVICLDILKKEWSPALTLRTALLSLQALLSDPNPSSPQDAEVAGQFVRDKAAFERTARYWTDMYAKPGGMNEAKIKKLAEMGFSTEKCQEALSKAAGDENAALEYLISH